MLESCFQRLFWVIRHVELTFQQICGGTVCNLRFFILYIMHLLFLVLSFPVLYFLALLIEDPMEDYLV